LCGAAGGAAATGGGAAGGGAAGGGAAGGGVGVDMFGRGLSVVGVVGRDGAVRGEERGRGEERSGSHARSRGELSRTARDFVEFADETRPTP